MSEGSRSFDEAAAGYDLSCRRLVPDLDGLYGAVVEGLPFGRGEELRVLDLGAGTGLLSVVVARRFPGAKITLADFSEKMLEVARRRCARSPGRFELRVLDYAREPLPVEAEGYDLVVSALSIHHLTHDDRLETFRKVYGALASGGWFVNADRVAGEPPEAGGVRHEHRPAPGAEPCDRDTPSHPAGAIDDATPQAQMTWLREAGFGEVECYYDNDRGNNGNRFAVYGGRKG